MIMGIDPIVESVADQNAELLWKAVGNHTLALNESGIAKGRFLAWRLAIDQCHLPSPALQMNGCRYADDPGAKHNCGLCHFRAFHLFQAMKMPLRQAARKRKISFHFKNIAVLNASFSAL